MNYDGRGVYWFVVCTLLFFGVGFLLVTFLAVAGRIPLDDEFWARYWFWAFVYGVAVFLFYTITKEEK
jgi:cell division protein FtsW (lipid II flippase)